MKDGLRRFPTKTFLALALGPAAGCGDGATPTVMSAIEERDASIVLVDAPPDPVGPRDAGSGDTAPSEAHAAETEPVADAPADVTADTPSNPTREGTPSDAIAQDREPAGYVKGVVGVGYGGIRIVSRDQGRTWSNRTAFAADGVDD